jgi:hypothetical protein
MKFIHDTLIKNKIKYFIVGGTLLGAVRHQGLIPHDDDGDICIFKKDVPKLRKLFDVFEKNGYILSEGNDEGEECINKKNSCTWYVDYIKDISVGGCDIFVMETKNNIITYADPYWFESSNGGDRCYFEKDQLFPLLPYRYGNFFMYGPLNSIKHLNTCYGRDWNSKGKMLFNHRTGEWQKGRKVDLESKDFLTLKPPLSTLDNNTLPIIFEKDKQQSRSKYFTPLKI